MNNDLKTLEHKEESTLRYRERVSGRALSETGTSGKKVSEHVFYGMHKSKSISPQDELNKLRDSRTDGL